MEAFLRILGARCPLSDQRPTATALAGPAAEIRQLQLSIVTGWVGPPPWSLHSLPLTTSSPLFLPLHTKLTIPIHRPTTEPEHHHFTDRRTLSSVSLSVRSSFTSPPTMNSQGPNDASVSPEAMQARIQQARREAETLKDRIKRKKDDLADTTRRSSH